MASRSLHTLGVFAATDQAAWKLPSDFERALAERLDSGWQLQVCREVSALPALLRDSDAVMGWPFPAALARRARRLRWVHFWTSGVPEAWRNPPEGVHVTSAAGLNAESVAEHALFLVLAALRGMTVEALAARRFDADLFPMARAPGQLDAVVIGAGEVGRRLATLLAPLFRQVHLVGQTARAAVGQMPSVRASDALPVLLPQSDVVVLALPLTKQTHSLCTSQAFYDSLGARVVLVNVARGELVDEGRLMAFLAGHPEARYLADVAHPEPYPPDGALWSSAQVWLTPHLGGRRGDMWPALQRQALGLLREKLARWEQRSDE